MTPEGQVKAKIDGILNNCTVPIWYFKPVQTGYGKRALDYVGVVGGEFFAIETKADGEEPTPYQRITAFDMWQAGAHVWVISNNDGVEAFRRWIRSRPIKDVLNGASW